MFPSWSRDNAQITYVTWTDDGLGAVVIAEMLAATDAHHGTRPLPPAPVSPDGQYVGFRKRARRVPAGR